MFSKRDDKNKDISAIEIRSDESDDDIPTTNKDDNGKSKDQSTQQKKYNLAGQWCLLTVFLLGTSLSIASLTAPSLRSAKPVLGLAFWQWSLLITALLAGPVLSQALKKFILFYTDHYSNEVYYLVMLLANAWAVLYFSLILLVWTWVVNQPSYLNAPRSLPDQEKNNILIKFTKVKHLVTLTLITILLGSFLWLLKDLCIMYGKKRFHTMRFFDRIKESLIDEYRIKILSGQPPVGASPSKDLFYIEKNIFGKMETKKIDLVKLCKVTQETVSSWMMKKLVDRIIDGRPLRFIDHRNNEVDFDSEKCAIEVSNIIFSRLVCEEDQDHPSFTTITKDQLKETLSKYFNTDDASEVMQWLLQGAGHADKIEKDLVKMRMIRAWRDRNALIRAMQSNKRIFKQLNLAVNVILVIVIFLVWIVMLRVEFRRILVFIGSAIVGSAFIFGDFCKKLLDSLVLIFVTHPYDVGDCCLIDKTPVTIDEINLLTTVAYTLDHEKRFYPHPVLVGLTISNFTRSRPYMGDFVEFYLDFHTPQEKIRTLKSEIRRYIRKNPQDWNPRHLLIVEIEMKDGKTYLKTTLQFQHTINYHDYRERQKRRNSLIFKLKSILEEQKLLEQNTNDNKDKK